LLKSVNSSSNYIAKISKNTTPNKLRVSNQVILVTKHII